MSERAYLIISSLSLISIWFKQCKTQSHWGEMSGICSFGIEFLRFRASVTSCCLCALSTEIIFWSVSSINSIAHSCLFIEKSFWKRGRAISTYSSLSFSSVIFSSVGIRRNISSVSLIGVFFKILEICSLRCMVH